MTLKGAMFSFIIQFLAFRSRQFYRIVAEQGIYAVVFYSGLLFLIAYLYKRSIDAPQFFVQLLVAVVFIAIEGNRKDLKFINYLKEKGKYLVLSEYLILFIAIEAPFCFFQVIDYYVLIPVLILLFFVFFRKQIQALENQIKLNIIGKVTSYLPLHAFEWRAGIRKNKVSFSILYLSGFLLLFLFPITPLFMFFWASYSGEFYKELENKEIIQGYKTVEHFATKKMLSFFITLNLLFAPHYLLYVLFYHQPDQLVILLFAIVLLHLICIYALVYKYKFAHMNQREVNNTVPMLAFMFIVIIAPLSLYLILTLWKNIKSNLKIYLK
jgi:hypothetical protein